jgi:DnaT-like ssDNA binding protein
MSYTFLVEDGSGFLNSNSYVSVLDASDYFTVDPNGGPSWTALTTLQQQKQLSWASRILDQKVRWKGQLAVPGSAMRWPRINVFDRDKNAIDSTIVPIQVKQATLELAKFLLTNDLTVGQDVDYLKLVRVDVIELEYQDHTGQSNVPAIINEILAGIGAMASGGPRFATIAKA